jgi:hypothetical protein
MRQLKGPADNAPFGRACFSCFGSLPCLINAAFPTVEQRNVKTAISSPSPARSIRCAFPVGQPQREITSKLEDRRARALPSRLFAYQGENAEQRPPRSKFVDDPLWFLKQGN